MNRKVIIGFVTIIALIFIAFCVFEPTKHQENNLVRNTIDHDAKPSKNHQQTLTTAEKIDSNATDITNKKTPSNSDSELSPEEMLEIIKWGEKRGYFEGESPYHGYDKNILEELANNGDPLAQLEIGDWYSKNNRLSKARTYFVEASINGYSYSLVQLSMIELGDFLKNPDRQESQANHKLLLSYAYLEVGLMRGDFNAQTLLDSYDTDKIYHLSEEEHSQAISMARQIYAQYEAIREDRGLGPFDNSTPKGLWKIYEKVSETQEQLQE